MNAFKYLFELKLIEVSMPGIFGYGVKSISFFRDNGDGWNQRIYKRGHLTTLIENANLDEQIRRQNGEPPILSIDAADLFDANAIYIVTSKKITNLLTGKPLNNT